MSKNRDPSSEANAARRRLLEAYQGAVEAAKQAERELQELEQAGQQRARIRAKLEKAAETQSPGPETEPEVD
jgi:vacuolar-type H+-ATPase subunit E/Vma4